MLAVRRRLGVGPMSEPLVSLEAAVAWYFEGADADVEVKHEGRVEVYPDWIRLGGPVAAWIPRERVGEVHEQ